MLAGVEQPGASETRRGAADRGDRDPLVEEASRGGGEGLPTAGVPQLRTGEDERVAAGGLEVG